MKPGDIVRIHNEDGIDSIWPESEGSIGVIVKMAMRMYIPAAKVMVLGEVAEWDLTELEKVCK